MNLNKEETIISGLTVFSLFLMAGYTLIRLYILRKPTIFFQSPLSCQNLSCQECDSNNDQIFNNLDIISLSYQLKKAGCSREQINKDLGYCFANCNQKQQIPKKNYSCQTKIFKDPNCQEEDWSFDYQSSTNMSHSCSKYNNGSRLTICQKN